MIAWLRALLARRAVPARFADVLAQTLRETDALNLRLSTVERSVNFDSDRPQTRASQED
jgi:hypothetical protein